MSCPNVPRCPLYPQLTEALAVWQRLYCTADGRYRSCARWCTAQSGAPVPPDLLPNGKRIAA